MEQKELPYDFTYEGLQVRILEYKFIYFSERINQLENSETLFFKVFYGSGVWQIVKVNNFKTDFVIIVFDAVIDAPVMQLMVTAALYREEPLKLSTDLWLVVDKSYSFMADEIKDKNIIDRNEKLITLPQNTLSYESFKRGIEHNF